MSRYLIGPVADDDRLRLVCCPPAGAGAAAYAGWQRALGDGVQVLPVRLPGRESRVREPCIRDGGLLLDQLGAELGPVLAGHRYAVYGHSLGALLGYALARRLRDDGAGAPRLLAVGASRAPQLPPLIPEPDRLTDGELAELAGRLAGDDRAAAGVGPGSRQLAAFRADLALGVTLRARPVPVGAPIVAFAALDDAIHDPAATAAWARLTEHGFEVSELRGGHFFHRRANFLRLLRAILDRHSG